ncbi:MAG: hypothetical protein AMDU2_EPLC00005G0464 [Thermoplasmatales archaeon E-plasma]|nr:MAG: hypothetical protein AMDU2_EPLC00005G0464 [Thermoplasmatales archaeon E-plasma]
MELYRYSLIKPDSKISHNFDTLIKFNKKSGTTPNVSSKKYIFTTPYILYDSNEINDRLSITYFPRWRSRIQNNDVKIYNNIEVKLNVDTKISDIPKTWPAFGKFGGIPEILLEAQDDIQLVCHQEIMNGGAVEQWHQDGVGNYNPPLNIAKIIWAAVQANDNFVSPDKNNDEDIISGIIRENNSTILNLPHNNKNVTFSAGYEFRTFELYIKIWAAYWVDVKDQSTRIDVKDQSTRYVRYESIDPIKILPCKYPDCLDCRELFLLFKHQEELKKRYIEKLDDSQSCAYLQIYDGVSKLIERINKISDSFLFTHSEHVALL